MSGSYIHIPAAGHRCDHPARDGAMRGTVWRCDECHAYWRFGYTDDSWGPVWYQPVWLNILPEKWARKWAHR